MLAELSPAFLELAKSPYGHFVATKLASTASAEELAGVAFLSRPTATWDPLNDMLAACDALHCVIIPTATRDCGRAHAEAQSLRLG